jgi:adenylyltransferase/sulfurtransferase
MGQRRLADARVLVVGAGGLGSPIMLYLAAAGVGTIGVIDDDVVEISNLHRQVIHKTSSVGVHKVASAAATIAALNPEVDVIEHPYRLTAETAADVIADYDLVLDGTDNFPTRYLVNDACVAVNVPLVWGSILGFAAQTSVFWPGAPGGGPELRDLFPHPPAPGTVPSCAEAGVVGAVCGQVGSVMAGEAIKLITGIGHPLIGRVLVIDVLRGRWDEIPLTARPREVNDRAREQGSAAMAEPAPSPDDDGTALDGTAVAGSVCAPVLSAGIVRERPDHVPATAFLLDVRTAEEYAADHIADSFHLPLADLMAGAAFTPPDGDRIVVVCRSGTRAEVAVAALAARGITAEIMQGGIMALGPGGQ